MSAKNEFGLSRTIPEPIKRAIRQRCGFGCVVCGSATLLEYHHFAPTFTLAKKHDPEGITLLCAKCHREVSDGLLSNETIIEHNNHPKSIQDGFSNYLFKFGNKTPTLMIGSNTFIGTTTIIKSFGKKLLSLEEPEESGAPLRINAYFYNSQGKEIAQIIRNEWFGITTGWDIQNSRNKFILHNKSYQISLKIRAGIPENTLYIDYLDMYYKGFRVSVKENEPVTAILPNGEIWFKMSNAHFIGNDTAILLEGR